MITQSWRGALGHLALDSQLVQGLAQLFRAQVEAELVGTRELVGRGRLGAVDHRWDHRLGETDGANAPGNRRHRARLRVG